MKTIGSFNVKSGVGSTTLVYHLAWMCQELGIRVAVLDLDPQSDLTSVFLSEEQVAKLWLDENRANTILRTVKPLLLEDPGDIKEPELTVVAENLALLPGDLSLSIAEDLLAEAWSRWVERKTADPSETLGIISSFHRLAHRVAQMQEAQLVLIDCGPGLSAINRAALIACDSIVIPLSTDLYSMQSFPVLSYALRRWRSGWKTLQDDSLPSGFSIPPGNMELMGYVLLQYARADPLTGWTESIPGFYHRMILDEPEASPDPDPHRLATLKYYPSLMPLAQDAHKPMFLLKPADGAIGSQTEAVQDCYRDFKQLAIRIAATCGIDIPS